MILVSVSWVVFKLFSLFVAAFLQVPVDHGGRNRGFGFIRLSDDEAAGPLAVKAHGFLSQHSADGL